MLRAHNVVIFVLLIASIITKEAFSRLQQSRFCVWSKVSLEKNSLFYCLLERAGVDLGILWKVLKNLLENFFLLKLVIGQINILVYVRVRLYLPRLHFVLSFTFFLLDQLLKYTLEFDLRIRNFAFFDFKADSMVGQVHKNVLRVDLYLQNIFRTLQSQHHLDLSALVLQSN